MSGPASSATSSPLTSSTGTRVGVILKRPKRTLSAEREQSSIDWKQLSKGRVNKATIGWARVLTEREVNELLSEHDVSSIDALSPDVIADLAKVNAADTTLELVCYHQLADDRCVSVPDDVAARVFKKTTKNRSLQDLYKADNWERKGKCPMVPTSVLRKLERHDEFKRVVEVWWGQAGHVFQRRKNSMRMKNLFHYFKRKHAREVSSEPLAPQWFAQILTRVLNKSTGGGSVHKKKRKATDSATPTPASPPALKKAKPDEEE